MVKRYGVRLRKHGGDHSPYMPTEIEMFDGEYVKYEDYAKLQAQIDGFADMWNKQGHEIAKDRRKIKRLQAQVDTLMLEYCPDEMTDDQVRNWGKHQVPEAAIKGEGDE